MVFALAYLVASSPLLALQDGMTIHSVVEVLILVRTPSSRELENSARRVRKTNRRRRIRTRRRASSSARVAVEEEGYNCD